MEFILGQNLRKSIKDELYESILKKIYTFSQEYIDNDYNLADMKSGWYVREIRGNTNIEKIYKFRVNEKDRVIFSLGKYLGFRDEYSTSLIFLEFCNHDEQIRRGRSIKIVNSVNVTNLMKSDDESDFDLYVNNKINEYTYDYTKTINRVVSLDEMKDMINKEDSRIKYYLNDEQYQIIKTDIKPFFLFGSAGSGKTTISIHKACALCNENRKIGYFTYSDYLKNDAENIFNNLKDEDIAGSVDFYSINQFLLYKSRKSQIIKYEEFEVWVKNILGKDNKLKPIDIWREIRGILKGLVSVDWMDIKIPINNNLSCDFLEYFEHNDSYGYIKDDALYIKKGCLAELKTMTLNNYKNDYSKDIDYIYSKIQEYICDVRILNKDTYMSLGKEYSRFSKDERNKIYSILEKYEDKLIKENKIDENDAVRLALRNNKNNREYDFIICDEIQDLTEMEIFFLLKIVKNPENLMFCGDYNQTINPTFFKTERIEAIYKTWNGLARFQPKIVTTNYRSSKSIVDFSNSLKELKKAKLKCDDKHDYSEFAIRDETDKIFILKADNIDKKTLSIINKERAYADILVPNENEKCVFLEETKGRGIYTVSEYKGLENQYIIGYNILSEFKNQWHKIFNSDSIINDNEFRYYFNLVYVFITRARDNICFIEENLNEEFIEYFREYVKVINEFNIDKLKLTKVSSYNEHYIRGKKLERDGQYEKAIDAYRNADEGVYEAERGIKRCMAFIENNKGMHIKAGKLFNEIGEYYFAGKCFVEGNNLNEALKAFVKNESTYDEIVSIFKKVDADLLNIVSVSDDDELNKNFNEIYTSYLKSKLSFAKCNIGSMNNTVEKIKDTANRVSLYKS